MTSPSRPVRDRRSFLKACGILGLGAIGGGVIQTVYNVAPLRHGLLRVSQTRLAMGTYVTMTVMHTSRDLAQEAIGRAFEEMDRLVAVFNRHDSITPVSVLNREGALKDPPRELVDLVRRSLYFHRLSHGAFDITVKPLVDMFERIKTGPSVVPTGDDIRAVLDLVDAEKIEISPAGLRFQRPGMGITLDGIAKGHIVDQAAHVLTAHGVDRHLINAGGDIRTRGTRADNRPWTIAIEDPRKQGNYPDVIQLTTGAVATSGSYEIYFDEEKVFHHLVNPDTGQSPHHHTSVSVMGDSVLQADALSTAVFVLDSVEGLRLINALDRCECLMADEHGHLSRSRGWPFSAHKT